MLKSPSEIPNPIQGSIAVFRNLDGAVYYKNPNGSIVIVDFFHDRYKIANPKFTNVLNYTDENIVIEKNSPQEYVFKLTEVSAAVTTMGMSGGRGPRGLTGPIGPQGPAGDTAPCLTDVTYAELVALILASGLDPGCFYRIIDYQTIYIIPNTTQEDSGPIEPLIVQAATENSIHEEAISSTPTILLPQYDFSGDEIFYEVFDSTGTLPIGHKGRIYFRWSTRGKLITNPPEFFEYDNQTWYDWRVIKFRRWETIPASGVFTVIDDNGGNFQDFYTFNEVAPPPNTLTVFATAPNCFSNKLGPITPQAINDSSAPPDHLNNIVFQGETYRNEFGSDCFNCSLGQTVGATRMISDNEVEGKFYRNIIGDLGIDSTGFRANTIKFEMSNNVIHSIFVGNNIQVGFAFNTIGRAFAGNEILGGFSNNNIAESFSGNTIGDAFRFNNIGNLFINNYIGDFFGMVLGAGQSGLIGNSIGDNFEKNEIGNNFAGNNIGNNFFENEIENNFGAIIEIAYSNLVGNFIAREIISIGVGSTALVIFDDGVSIMRFVILKGIPNTGETITGEVTGATATIDSIVVSLGNNIGNNFNNNEIGNTFYGNNVGAYFFGNDIGNNFSNNSGGIAPTYYFGFRNNVILEDFSGNINIGDNFQKNHIESNLPPTDFGIATHVYADYTFVIEKANSGTYYGHYISDPADIAAGTVTYVAPNV